MGHRPVPPLGSEERKRLLILMRILGWTRKPRGLDFYTPETGYLEIVSRKTKQSAVLMSADAFGFRDLCHAVQSEPPSTPD